MQDIDKTQSFTAQLFVDNKPVALAGKVIQKLLEAPDITEELKRVLGKSSNTPETFFSVMERM